MSRYIFMLVPALAFALPFAGVQTSMARPLANQTLGTFHGDDDDDDKDDDDDDNNGFIELTVCFETQIAIDLDDRAYSCDIVQGPSCFASCTAAAVAPLCETQLGLGARAGDLTACESQRMEQCRSQCEDGGAAFCAPAGDLTTRKGHHDDDDDDDDDDKGKNEVVFIDVEVCLDLQLDLDNL